MSRIGKLPVQIIDGIKVEISGQHVAVSGPKGKLARTFPENVVISLADGKVIVTPRDKTAESKAFWGLTRKLISNMVEGVTTGFTKKLEINGVGYKAAVSNGLIKLSLGFSHDIYYAVPDDITVVSERPTSITISGSDKEKVGQIAAEIRAFKKPEPYKGKGIKYEGERIRRKEGKKK